MWNAFLDWLADLLDGDPAVDSVPVGNNGGLQGGGEGSRVPREEKEVNDLIIREDHWSKVGDDEWTWRNFTPMEMACRGTGRLIVPVDFMENLQSLRDLLGEPMHITSGCRTLEHNENIGGAKRSFHVCDDPMDRGQDGCLAVDIAATEGSYRGKLFVLAWNMGFSIGWNAKRGFLHLDRRVDVGWKQTTFDY